MSYVVFSVHVVPFVQQQFQTLTGIRKGSMMGSSHATLYENEVEAVIMMMKMMVGGGEGRDNKVCLCYVYVYGEERRKRKQQH